jgi:uncharacterized protein YjdB
MRKQLAKVMIVLMIMLSALCINRIGGVTVKAAKSDARIVDYDSGSRTERFHYGRNVGQSVNVTVVGDKDSMKVANIKFVSSDSAVCSVQKVDDHYKIQFLKEGIAVITMTCKVDGENVQKRLLASCLTSINSAEGVLKAESTVYRGCSDKEGISSKNTEVKAQMSYDEYVSIDGICGEYYRVWLEDGTFGESNENWAYVKKKDVIIPMEDIIIPEEMKMYEDTEQDMEIQYIPDIAIHGDFLWKSSNTNVVKVDGNGKLMAGKKGSAVVTVTSVSDSSITKKCRVTVRPYIPVTGIKIIPDKTEADNGVLGKIKVQIIPEDASVQDYTWHVSNDEVIKVDPKGRYIGKRPGTATISVTTKEGNFKDSCEIKILPVKVKGVALQKEAEIDVNEIKPLVWSTIPTNATNKNVVWKSDNESIVKVDEFGNAIGVALGSANISVVTEEGNYIVKCKVTVSKFVNDIQMKKTYYKLKVGKTKKINVRINPVDCTKKELVWRTSNSPVVTVSQEGIIKSKIPGEAKVTVYDQYTGAFDFALINVTADFKKPDLKISSKNKKYTLSWKKQKYATKYIVYEKAKGKKKFKKKESIDGKKTKYVLGSAKKQNQYKIRCYCKSSSEYSKYSNIVEVN